MVPKRPTFTEISDEVGRNVQTLREDRRWSQDKLAALCRVSKRVIRDIESSRPDGTRRPISVDELHILARALGVSPGTLWPRLALSTPGNLNIPGIRDLVTQLNAELNPAPKEK